ncbi:MAG: FtsK/SpoIIIE domain-containing protein, partial [Planctomycetota bacterium]|nr:FtsK/SpoIIIE domain-containing protein [Planctomycetota bacterium]
ASGLRTALAQFRDAMADVSQTFGQVESQFAETLSVEKGNYTQDLQRLGDEFQQIHDQISAEYFTQLEAARVRFEQAVLGVSTQETAEIDHLTETFRTTIERAEYDAESAKVRQNAGYEDAQRQRKLRYREQLTHCEQYQKELDSLISGVEALMSRRGTLARFHSLRAEKTTEASSDRTLLNPSGGTADTMLTECSQSATRAAELMHTIGQWSICRFVDDGWPILVGILLLIAIAIPGILAFGWIMGTGVALLTAVIGSIGSYLIARQRGRTLVVPHIGPLAESITQSARCLAIARSESKLETRADLKQLHRKQDDSLQRLDADLQRTRKSAQDILDATAVIVREKADAQRKKLEEVWQAETHPIRQRYLPLLENRQSEYEQTLERRRTDHQQNSEVLKTKYDARWQKLTDQWQSSWDAWIATTQAMNQYRATHFLPWDATETTHSVSHDLLPAIAFGECSLALDKVLAQSCPSHVRLRVPQQSFHFPAFLAIPDEASLLLQAKGEGRTIAVGALRNILLRFIQAVPPGKFRLTIIDPTGLGQNFSELMHLADFDERLVRSRIWTEPAHIQQRLVDLTEHMENVIQKYLRNDYATIQEYNERAGEVAEPFQLLAIANFPANFTEEAAQRLIRIVSAGARCGVFTIMSSDSQLALPRNFDLSDLKRHTNTLEWNEDRQQFEWCDPLLRPCDVQLEQPPVSEQINRMVRQVGQLAVEHQRVEVPFRKVMPTGAWWQSDCADQLEVPIGRVGATRLQCLTLGRGTSQHVLMAGKTGSGKSTLLHALITNAALHYSPSQLQFYLIDFKKGVEFKPYARYRLPHARVIAIESEREFGLSVLERLDAELRARGDRFRELGVQDLASFRRACADSPTPRILLVIDEFQEFFIKEDKISQSAALLLDRLVRQGRAFGIHVLLGSQTLSGAYSLARSTIGQMAVRIALQCSETDAHMILSED